MKCVVFSLALILLPVICNAMPAITYSTMIEDSTYYNDGLTFYGTQGHFAADVDSEGNLYVGVPISKFSHEIPSGEDKGIRIYRINAEGTDLDIVSTIYGYHSCTELIWSETGLYAQVAAPNTASVMKINEQGDIIFVVDSYNIWSPIFIDAQGCLFIAATIDSADTHIDFEHIPVTPNALDPSYNGWDDILIQKYDPNGNLMYSSFLGGEGNDSAMLLTVDNESRLYIAAQAAVDVSNSVGGESETVMVNPGIIVISPDFTDIKAYEPSDYSFRSPNKICIDADELYSVHSQSIEKRTLTGELVSVISLDDEIPTYTYPWPSAGKPAYYSNNKLLTAFIDDQNHIYSVHFKAPDEPFTTTAGALYPDPNPGELDLGIWQFTDDAELLYGTYFGGSGIEETTMNAVAYRDGRLYVAGYTNSEDFPLTPGAYIDTREHHYRPAWGLFAFCIDFNESTGVAEESDTTLAPLTLAPPHPNPFNPATTLSFTLPEAGFVRLAVYNLSGQMVRELAAETLPAGRHEIVWDGRDSDGARVASGIYIARLAAGGRSEVRKVTLVR